MNFQELLIKKDSIKKEVVTQINEDIVKLKTLAESMIECATNITGMGYVSFIQSRDTFLCELDRIRTEYTEIFSKLH